MRYNCFVVDVLCILTDYAFLGVNYDCNTNCVFFPQKKSVIRPGVVTIIDTLNIGTGEVQCTKSFFFSHSLEFSYF